MLPVVVAHTVLVSGEDEDEKDVKIGGALGNLMHATNTAMEAAIRKLHVGSTNSEVTRVINAVADAFGVKPVQGVLSHNMARFVIDGEKVIISTTDAETKVDEVKFEELEVWTLDIIMSSGDGKPREVDDKPTIFKRSVDVRYQLKMKASNYVLGEINEKFPVFPFTLRAVSDSVKAKLGIVECLNHGMVQDFPVLLEKESKPVYEALVLPD